MPTKIYCGICKKWWTNQTVGGRCAVNHPLGDCCHFGQSEIKVNNGEV